MVHYLSLSVHCNFRYGKILFNGQFSYKRKTHRKTQLKVGALKVGKPTYTAIQVMDLLFENELCGQDEKSSRYRSGQAFFKPIEA